MRISLVLLSSSTVPATATVRHRTSVRVERTGLTRGVSFHLKTTNENEEYNKTNFSFNSSTKL